MCIRKQVTFNLIIGFVVSNFVLQFVLIVLVFFPIEIKSMLRVNKKSVVGNNFWKGSKLSVEVFCVVVFIFRKCFMDHLHLVISFNLGFFLLFLPDNSRNSDAQVWMKLVCYGGWGTYNILSH